MNLPQRRVSQRLANLAPSATLAVDAKAKSLKAAGEPVIGFGAGEPDFPTPPAVIDAAITAASDPGSHHYTPAKGQAELRTAIATKTTADWNFDVDPETVVVTNGGKQAVYQAFQALVDPGDDVLLPAPYWTTYPEAIALAGGTPVVVLAGAAQKYKVTVAQLEAALTPATKVLVMCTPSNPTGAVYTADELRTIGAFAREHGLWIISDEIYENLSYAGPASHLLTVVPELADQTIVVNGVAKTYAMTGWRVGWMFGPADVMKKVANFQSHLTSNVNNIAQRAALAAITGDQRVVSDMRDSFDQRRHLIVDMLRKIECFDTPEPDGAFYVFPNVERALGRDIRGRSAATSAELADLILEEVKVAVVPGEAFGAPGHLRLSYALSESDIREGIGRLQELFAGI